MGICACYHRVTSDQLAALQTLDTNEAVEDFLEHLWTCHPDDPASDFVPKKNTILVLTSRGASLTAFSLRKSN